MRIVLAPNALRGSLRAIEAAQAMAQGARRAAPAHAEVLEIPIADGGDGTAEILARATGASREEARVSDPLGRIIDASWYRADPIDGAPATALIELAEASGSKRLSRAERNPNVASTRGTGALMAAALSAGCKRIVLGVGGSATVDGGAGLLQALGVDLLDRDGTAIGPGGRELLRLAQIDIEHLVPAARTAEIVVLCDVVNPALGDDGAAPVFAPQKGATREDVAYLSDALAHFCDVLHRSVGIDVRTVRHGGAAGAAAAGLFGVLGARLVAGIDYVLSAVHFEDALGGAAQRASLVITAEGAADAQTLGRKGPFGVAEAARVRDVPVVLVAGSIDSAIPREQFAPFDAIFSLCRGPISIDSAMRDAAPLLAATTEEIVRLFLASSR
jgi:glycerate kinase